MRAKTERWASPQRSTVTSLLLLAPQLKKFPPVRTFRCSEIHPCYEYNHFDLRWGEFMYHYDAKLALEELQEDALLPHPVKLRDMILRTKLGPIEAKALNQEFQTYLTRFGELQKTARSVLEKLAAGQRKAS